MNKMEFHKIKIFMKKINIKMVGSDIELSPET